jgi:hypothetical protein
MTGRVWTDSFLDALRQEGDPEADTVVSAYFNELGREDPGGLFRATVTRQTEDTSPAVRDYLAHVPEPPAWLDPTMVAAGQERFARWGSHVFTALYGAALPSAYACTRGVQVLGFTARLVTDAKRRLNETAQFHLDVMESRGLTPEGRGFDDIRHVRLMHAAVRWLITHDEGHQWDPSWGVPVNQEDLLETLLTFTEVVFEVFDKTGVVYRDEDAEAYLHTWSYIGYLLGIRPDLLPLTRDDTRTLMADVRRRHFGTSEAGTLLMAALLEQASAAAPRALKDLPATAVRFYVGDATADLLGVPPADWTRAMFGPLAKVTKVFSLERAHRRLLDGVSDRLGLGMLQAAVRAERSGGRAPFAIPTELAGRWGVSPTGVPQGAAHRRARRAARL